MASGVDVLMRVVVAAGGPALAAESLTDFEPLVPGDPMVSDFKPGFFCELNEFDFSAGAESSMSKRKEAVVPEATTKKGPAGVQVAKMVAQFEQRMAIERSIRERIERREAGEFVDMREVNYTRIMDSASPILFKALTDCTTLASISVVKRKGAGAATSGLGYLRLDFEEVLITSLAWKDSEHVMKESGSFIYRKLSMNYLIQKANGDLVPGSSAHWRMRATRTGT